MNIKILDTKNSLINKIYTKENKIKYSHKKIKTKIFKDKK